MMQLDLVISENLNRIDPRANWQITPKAMFAQAPTLCYIPTRIEKLQMLQYAPYGNQHQPMTTVSSLPTQCLRPLVEANNVKAAVVLTEQVRVFKFCKIVL